MAIPLSVLVAAQVFLPHFGYRGIFAMLALTQTLVLVLLLSLVRVPAAYTPDLPSRGGETGQKMRTLNSATREGIRVRMLPGTNSKGYSRAIPPTRASGDGYTYGYTYRAREEIWDFLAVVAQFAFDEELFAERRTRMGPKGVALRGVL